jgi:hypothetical protein
MKRGEIGAAREKAAEGADVRRDYWRAEQKSGGISRNGEIYQAKEKLFSHTRLMEKARRKVRSSKQTSYAGGASRQPMRPAPNPTALERHDEPMSRDCVHGAGARNTPLVWPDRDRFCHADADRIGPGSLVIGLSRNQFVNGRLVTYTRSRFCFHNGHPVIIRTT